MGPRVAVETAGEETESSTGTEVSSPPTTPPPGTDTVPVPVTETSSATTTSTTTPSDEEGSSSTTEDSVSFITDPDIPETIMCDPFAQDCPAGQKCMWYADDGGSSWNATACFPVAPDPAQLEEPCTVEDNGVSGVDTCDVGLMCWNVDADTLQGNCIAYCTGSDAEPMCQEGPYSCSINSGGFALCLHNCDPVEQDCPEGQGCYGVNSEFHCTLVAGDGVYGDACGFLNVCEAGHACIGEEQVPDCEDEPGCCSPFCDTTLPNTCPGEGQTCVPWYEAGEAPPEYEDVGICGMA